jgi:hypothetical protein
MTIQIPEPVQWLVPLVVGTNWPEGDEDALRRLAQAWEQAATAICQATGEGNVAARTALGTMQGEAADAFAEYWDRFVAGDEQFLVTLQHACEQLGEGCDEAALNIEYTKLSIIAALLILAAQIAAMIAAAFATFGASTAGIPIAQVATRVTVQLAFQKLISQIVINAGVDVAIQGLQLAGGDRESWELGKTADAGLAGVAAGAASGGVGLASAALGRTTSRFAAAALRGAGEGVIAGAGGNALNDLAHGTAPSLQSLGSGAVSGSVGGVLDGTINRHRGLHETWHSPENSDYTAGANTQGWRHQTPAGTDVRANVDNPYSGSWNSGGAQHIPSGGEPNNVHVDNDDYLLPTALELGDDA